MGSVRRRGEVIRLTLDRDEAGLLVSLMSQVRGLLAVPAAGESVPGGEEPESFEDLVAGFDLPAHLPEGPILERLLPDAYRDDPDAAQEFRRLTDTELRTTKGQALQRVLDDLAIAGGLNQPRSIKVDLDEDAAQPWLHALNDVRLALGTHLGIRDEGDAARVARTPENPLLAEYAIYDWLSWFQESIVRELTGT